MTGKASPYGEYYQIIVRGHLKPDLHSWLNGMCIQNLPDGKAALTGPITDQSMLHGLLIKIRDLGLPLISINSTTSMIRKKES